MVGPHASQMKLAGVHSALDPAGVQISAWCERLLDDCGSPHDWEFVELPDRLIHAERIDQGLDAELVVFLSRHTSMRPVPQLTVHATGNVGEAALGGEADQVAPCPPGFMQAVLRGLALHAPGSYRVSYERTHHGPTALELPSCFVEIGSGPEEWRDPAAGESVARAVLAAVPAPDAVPLLGLGGAHYATRQTAIALATRGAFGHIVRTDELGRLDPEWLARLVAASGAVGVHLDQKAVSRSELERLRGLLDDAGLPMVGEGELAGLGRLPWSDYVTLLRSARALAPDATLRLGTLASCPDPVSIEVEETLFSEALRSDEAGLVAGLEALPIALLLSSGRPHSTVLARAGLAEQIIHDLITLGVKTITGNQQTTIVGDRLIIRRERFDPIRASALGVPPGALYGRLQRGEPVVIDRLEIRPEMVRSPCATEVFVEGLEKYL